MKKYKFSIITPTHKNSIFLLELYQSIKRQSYSNWEWILYLNGDFKGKLIDKEILADKRVFIFDTNKSFKNIGEIKCNAFNLATGDILVEVDHDDMIHCDCLAELNKSYQNDDVGFVYSDSLLYDLQGKMKPWDKSLGWEYSMEEYNKKSFIRHLGFRPTSRSLAFIWYAPDHVRSWRKSVYDAIGGHNKSLEVCDDHELLIRTYLYTNFHHIKKCLYYYRILPDMTNTQFLRNEKHTSYFYSMPRV